jgi:hypothetical protein
MPDEGSGKTVRELEFFIAPSIAAGWIYRFTADTGRG